MDLSNFKTASGKTLTLTHPVTGEDLPITITVAGIESKEYKAAAFRYTDKRLQSNKKPKAEELDAAKVEILSASTLEWTDVEWEGKAFPCTKENAKFLYRNVPWIRHQVQAFQDDEANYFEEVAGKSEAGASGASG